MIYNENIIFQYNTRMFVVILVCYFSLLYYANDINYNKILF